MQEVTQEELSTPLDENKQTEKMMDEPSEVAHNLADSPAIPQDIIGGIYATDQHGHIVYVNFQQNQQDSYTLVEVSTHHQVNGIKMGFYWDKVKYKDLSSQINGMNQAWGGYAPLIQLQGDTTLLKAILTSPSHSGSLTYNFYFVRRPEFTFTANGNEIYSTNASTAVNVTHTDQQQLYFTWSQNTVTPDEDADWQPFANGQTFTLDNVSGDWYLHTRAIHSSGATIVEQHSERFRLDQSVPVVTVNMVDDTGEEYTNNAWTNEPITAAASVYDKSNSLKSLEYSLDEGETWITHDADTLLHFNQQGVHVVHYRMRDQRGHEETIIRTIRIDKTAPSLTFEPDGHDQVVPFATTSVQVTDEGGSELAVDSLVYIWTQSEDSPEPGAKWTHFKEGEELILKDADGTWYLHIQAMDQAGNHVEVHSKPFHLGGTAYKNADLSGIGINGKPLPEFDHLQTDYSWSVGYSQTSIIVTPTAVEANAKIEVGQGEQYEEVLNGKESKLMPLKVGNNKFSIRVTAPDGISVKSYTLQVERAKNSAIEPVQNGGSGSSYLPAPTPTPVPAPKSNVAELSQLVLSIGEWKVPFSSKLTDYRVDVPSSTDGLTVQATAENSRSSIQVNGVKVLSGKESERILLQTGKNIIHIIVTAEDGTTLTYQLTIHRTSEIAPPSCQANPQELKDIEGHWSEQYIIQASCSNLAQGYPDGSFQPNQEITRAEFLMMLMNVFGSEQSEFELNFTDQEEIGSWAKPAVQWAVSQSAVTGYPDGTIRPNGSVTRAEMAAIVSRMIESPDSLSSIITDFQDDSNIPEWAKPAVAMLKKREILQGREGNRFNPNTALTRAEAVTVLLKASKEFNTN
ncbi:S-layer homology domain-containing protein [Paenibacillus tundrae]|uniref:S-layer homology domain-containing protein n=1 Tax=Paenibacillus tundrae TaxID=528187 RepID=UPI0030D381BE